MTFCHALLFQQPAYAEGTKQASTNSVIVEVEGMACLGQDRTRTQTQKLAIDAAKQKASEKVSTYVSRNTEVSKGRVHKDVIDVFSQATIKVLDEIEKGWIKSSAQSEYVDSCYRIKIKAEVIPPEQGLETANILEDPRAPLNIQLWTDKDTYNLGDKLKFYFQGNKPFYARAVYKDSDGNLIEITPHSQCKYYNGGVIHEIPGHNDNFTLTITPPFGKEELLLYASTNPISNYQGQNAGKFYVVNNTPQKISTATRGLAVLNSDPYNKDSGEAEFAEAKVSVMVNN